MKAKDLKLVKTCDCFPEQYDVKYKDKLVGYIRYRYGEFQVHPVVNHELELSKSLYTRACSKSLFPQFRSIYLEQAKVAIAHYHNNIFRKLKLIK